MGGKSRVHELAKELGVTSKEVLAWLSEHDEFVKSAPRVYLHSIGAFMDVVGAPGWAVEV